MSAFVIVEVLKVKDPSAMQAYAVAARPTVERHGGTFRVLRGQVEVLEGQWALGPLVMIEFPSMQQARAWYDSDDYRPLIAQRRHAADVNLVFVEGLA